MEDDRAIPSYIPAVAQDVKYDPAQTECALSQTASARKLEANKKLQLRCDVN
jgi:hypothetical protein